MIKFKIGDRVLCQATIRYKYMVKRGTIIYEVDNLPYGGDVLYGVEFDDFVNGHSGFLSDISGKYGHVWNLFSKELTPLCNCNTLGCEGECNDKV